MSSNFHFDGSTALPLNSSDHTRVQPPPPVPVCQRCAAVPLHGQICKRAPSVALLLGMSRHLSRPAQAHASPRRCHACAAVPLQSQICTRAPVTSCPLGTS